MGREIGRWVSFGCEGFKIHEGNWANLTDNGKLLELYSALLEEEGRITSGSSRRGALAHVTGHQASVSSARSSSSRRIRSTTTSASTPRSHASSRPGPPWRAPPRPGAPGSAPSASPSCAPRWRGEATTVATPRTCGIGHGGAIATGHEAAQQGMAGTARRSQEEEERVGPDRDSEGMWSGKNSSRGARDT